MDMINIGYSGASTAQVELNVTAQNTANAMTTGYTRQVAEISTIGASGGSPNSAGNGVQVDSIRRVSNQYQVNQVWYAASDYGYYSTQQGYLSQLEAVLSDDNSSLSGGFDNFFAALNEATTSPDDSALREQVISEAGALSLRIDNTLDYIDSQSTEIISQQQAMVSQINTLTSGIASYNQQIAQAEANGDNASALYDARDQMVEELSGMMDVQVNIDDQGNYNVTLKNGQPLVSGQQSSTIALETNADGTSTMSLTFAGTTSTMTTDTGGSLGALFDYQNDVLTPLTDTINSMASQFAGRKRQQRQPAGADQYLHRTAGNSQPRQRDGRAGVLVNHQQYRHLQSAKPDGSRCRVQCLFRSAKPAEQRQRRQHGRRGGEPDHLSTNL